MAAHRPSGAPPTQREIAAAESLLDEWFAEQLAGNPVIEAVEKESDLVGRQRRWYVRVRGEEKDVSTIWWTLDQRALHFECYVLPAPEENAAELFEHLLRRNLGMRGMAFAVGAEDAVYLVGLLPLHALDASELDRILGSVYSYVELSFRPAMRIGFRSRFKG